MLEKEKMLVTSIFSFSHNVFKSYYPVLGSLKVVIVWSRVKLMMLITQTDFNRFIDWLGFCWQKLIAHYQTTKF